MTLPTESNVELYRGDTGQSISFEHDLTPADVTEALCYIRDRIDGTLYVRIKLSEVAAQWSITAGEGTVSFLTTDLDPVADGNYVYDIKLITATVEETFQRGIVDIIGDVSTDVGAESPPTLEFYVTSDQNDALDGANSPSSTNVFATMDDVEASDTLAELNDVNLSGLADKNLLVYDSASSKWINQTISEYDAELGAIAGLTSAADKLPYFTGSGTAALADFTAFGRSLVDDANAAAGRTTLGLGTIATQDANVVSITGGSIAGIADLAVADGGTGASNAANARTNLGVAIGSDVQAWDADLDALAALSGTGLVTRTGAQTYTERTIIGTANQVIVSNGDGVAGNPTLTTPQDIATGSSPTFADLTISAPVNIYALSHDSFADYVANEHINHTAVTLTAGTGLTGGGDISASRSFAVSGVLEDFVTLGAPTADGEFIVATGAGVFAYETGNTARTSLGLGTGDSPTFAGVTSSGDVVISNGSGLIVGNASQIGAMAGTPEAQVLGTGQSDSSFVVGRWQANALGPFLILAKSRNGTIGSNTIIQDDDDIGTIYWAADDGTNLDHAIASINAEVDGAPGANDLPGRIILSTTPDGSNVPVEAMRLDSSQNTTLAGDLTVSGTGPHAIGDSVRDYNQVRIGGSFTSQGSSSTVSALDIITNITAANGDTTWQSLQNIAGSVTTQSNTETISYISSLRLKEPTITIGTDTAPVATTLLIVNAPTEGDTNWAGYVASGDWYFGGNVGIGLNPTANMDGLSIEAGLLTLKETTTPTADTNYGKIYTKTDNKLYFQDGAGTEHEIQFV